MTRARKDAAQHPPAELERHCISLFIVSGLLRAVLIAYSIWHDAHSALKYTDIDYQVFTDAAKEVASGSHLAQGPLAPLTGFRIGDAYARETYRYTPLLAVFMLPNIYVHPAFGKGLFCLADLGVGWLLLKIMRRRAIASRLIWVGALWLLNPWVAAISSRGSSEALLGLLVVASLERAEAGALAASAIWLGLATHFKLYPVVYGAAMVSRLRRPSSVILYGTLGGLSFLFSSYVMYLIWGWPFISEAFLYHARRLDLRHNFSPYFYPIYLSSTDQAPSFIRHPLISFVPQLSLTLGLGFRFGSSDLALAWFLQTFAFVTFNKVCTSQYFLWYIWFLPIVLPLRALSQSDTFILPSLWVGGQAVWLSFAYRLEFLGEPVFRQVWLASVAFFLCNCWILWRLIVTYAPKKV